MPGRFERIGNSLRDWSAFCLCKAVWIGDVLAAPYPDWQSCNLLCLRPSPFSFDRLFIASVICVPDLQAPACGDGPLQFRLFQRVRGVLHQEMSPGGRLAQSAGLDEGRLRSGKITTASASGPLQFITIHSHISLRQLLATSRTVCDGEHCSGRARHHGQALARMSRWCHLDCTVKVPMIDRTAGVSVLP